MICNVKEDYVFVQVPEVLYDLSKLAPIADKYYYKYKVKLKLRRFKSDIQLKIQGKKASFILKKIFSEYNGIDVNFLEGYKRKRAPFGFNGLGELVYMRTYSRIKDDGKNEMWWETVRRVVEGTYNMQKKMD